METLKDKKTEKRRFRLAAKLNLVTIIMILTVAAGLLAIVYKIQADRVTQHYYQRAQEAAWSAARVMDSRAAQYMKDCLHTDTFRKVREKAVSLNDGDIIVEWMENTPGYGIPDSVFYSVLHDSELSREEIAKYSLYSDYKEFYDELQILMNDSEITYAYLQYLEDGEFYTLADPDLGALGVGACDEDIPEFYAYTSDYQKIPATVYHCSYGWLCTAYEPLILPGSGKMCALAGIDISMDQIIRERHMFLVNSIVFVLLLTGVCILINLFLIRRVAVRPLQLLTRATRGFGKNSDRYTMDDVINVDIHSNDEINDLYQTIRGMQTRMVRYTEDLEALTAEKARVGTEMELAANIQSSMLQSDWPAFPDRTDFTLHAFMQPAREVGGDFYDFFLIDDDHLALIIADVSGKGIPASLVMMSSMILLRTQARNGGTPARVLAEVNDQLSRNNKSKMFVTVWMGILDTRTGVMTCASAGHEYPVLRGGDGIYRLFKDKHGFVVGGMEGMAYKDYELALHPGDVLFVYTDGIPETNNEKEEFYGTERLTQALNDTGSDDSTVLIDAMSKSTSAFRGSAEQFDDMTMLCIRYNGKM